MTTNYLGDLIVTTSINFDQKKETRLLYVGDDNFLEGMPKRKHYAPFRVNDGLMAMVDNWYGQYQNHMIVEVMDAGLRMRPDTVVFNYDDLFAVDYSDEHLNILLTCLSFALNSGYSVAVSLQR